MKQTFVPTFNIITFKYMNNFLIMFKFASEFEVEFFYTTVCFGKHCVYEEKFNYYC